MKIALMKSASYTLIGLLFITITSCTGQNNSDNSYSQQDPYGQGDQYGQPNQNYSNQGQNQGQYPGQNQGQYPGQANTYNTNNNVASQQGTAQNQGGNNIVMHPVMDPKTNQPMLQIPLPASWKFQKGGPNDPSITGPDGIEIFYYPMRNFLYSNDQFMQQSMQSSGQQMRQPAGIEAIMSQDVAQQAKSNGLKFIKQYPLPQVAQSDRSYMDQLQVVGERNYKFLAGASEWESSNGNKVLIITHYNEMPMGASVSWGYYVQVLGSKPAAFENAKNAYINGLANTQYNPQQIATYNQQESGRINQSWANHNQKMQNNQQNFDAQQRAHQSSVDSWNKSSMDAYNDRSATDERIQNRTINSINETQNVTDPNNGQQYQVEGYSNQYWMNGQGEYIPSDNSLYNPNQDANYNDQNWEEAPVSPY